MSNMSYCEIHNTVVDMEQVLNSLEEKGISKRNKSELKAFKSLYDKSLKFIEQFEFFEEELDELL